MSRATSSRIVQDLCRGSNEDVRIAFDYHTRLDAASRPCWPSASINLATRLIKRNHFEEATLTLLQMASLSSQNAWVTHVAIQRYRGLQEVASRLQPGSDQQRLANLLRQLATKLSLEPSPLPQPVATPEVVATPKLVAMSEPVATPKLEATPEPMVTPDTVATPEPVATPKLEATPESMRQAKGDAMSRASEQSLEATADTPAIASKVAPVADASATSCELGSKQPHSLAAEQAPARVDSAIAVAAPPPPARPPLPLNIDPNEYRVDSDGLPYTAEDFREEYGDKWERYWRKARKLM
mmetsp:Transcript_69951/g.116164  ORF Transcript_69951/g.116164 Transcript_69951/m.116164 type:complete len:298 (-) Transcript_69951:176-1069(-)